MDPKIFYKDIPSLDTVNATVAPKSDFHLWELIGNTKIENLSTDCFIQFLKSISSQISEYFMDIEARQSLLDVSNTFSEIYASLLKSENKRELRMWLQYTNYSIRAVLDKNTPPDATVSVTVLNEKCPWDFLFIDDKKYIISSDEKNFIYYNQNGQSFKSTCGLPTQLDLLDANKISIGSYYNNGGYIYSTDNNNLDFINHQAPILLFFYIEGNISFIDAAGQIWTKRYENYHMYDKIGFGLNRVRKFGNKLYLMEWSHAYKLYEYDLRNKKIQSRSVPTIITNDICASIDSYYLIDKQQGGIYKVNEEFKYVYKRLSFGAEKGKMFDPISIKTSIDGKLCSLNWVNSHLLTLPIF